MGKVAAIPLRQLLPEIQGLVELHAPGPMPRDSNSMAWVVVDNSIF